VRVEPVIHVGELSVGPRRDLAGCHDGSSVRDGAHHPSGQAPRLCGQL